LNVILGKDSLDEFCALPRDYFWMFLQKMTHSDQTLLQGSEFLPFDNIELGFLDGTMIDLIEIRIHLREVIDPHRF
jgi:hypothetical protein